jgi:hypothetical protein
VVIFWFLFGLATGFVVAISVPVVERWRGWPEDFLLRRFERRLRRIRRRLRKPY